MGPHIPFIVRVYCVISDAENAWEVSKESRREQRKPSLSVLFTIESLPDVVKKT